MNIVRCVSCDGYGWEIEEYTEVTVDCDWCGGTGYVYRDEQGLDHRIPEADYGKVSAILENLEDERMRELGYTGSAKHPDDQAIRQQRDDDEI